MAGFLRDLGYAVRVLRWTPGFTAVATATLALGIGATTAMFTVVDAVLLRPLPFPEPERLAMLRPSSGARLSPEYLDAWRRESRTFEDLAGWHDLPAVETGGGEPLEVLADRATVNLFSLLGAPALLGRTFTDASDLGAVKPEVVLGHGFWQRRYGGDPGVIGRPITLDGETFTVVGVMPPGFTLRTNESSATRAELWMPFRFVPGTPAGMGGFLNVVGRLAPGARVEQAQGELSAIHRRIEEAYPSYSREWVVEVLPLLEATVRDVRPTLLVLFGGVGILLLVACVNLANLMLGRGAARGKELAIRLSLGATTGRLVRQSLVESFVLAGVGGALGVLLAAWGTELALSAVPPALDLPRAGQIEMDARVLAFAGAAAVLTAILFGLFPALAAARSAHRSARAAMQGASASGGGSRFGNVLIVAEVGLALVLLAGGGLVGRSLRELGRVDPGFEPERAMTLRATLPAHRYDTPERIRAFTRELLPRLESLPGVGAVGWADYLPLSGAGVGAAFEIEGRAVERPEERPRSWVSVVGGRYFEAMGIPLLRGRLPGEGDTEEAEPVFVIDEELARRYWPNEDPIGARLIWRRGELSGEIVGVVGSVRWAALGADPIPTTYFWFPQEPVRDLHLVARTVGDPAALAGAMAAAVRRIDPDQPVPAARAMRDWVSADLARPRFTMLLLGGFAAVASFLVAVGLHGMVAGWVAARRHEIGVRVALGARPRDILRGILRRGMLLVGCGIAIGTAAALGTGRLASGLLYGVAPSDPPTLLAVALLLAAIALMAAYVSARRALRVDPVAALKAE